MTTQLSGTLRAEIVGEMMDRRAALRDELRRAADNPRLVGSEWFRDRADEFLYLTQQLGKFGVLPMLAD